MVIAHYNSLPYYSANHVVKFPTFCFGENNAHRATTTVNSSFVPFKLFFDMNGITVILFFIKLVLIENANASYSPSYEFTIADLLNLASKLPRLFSDPSDYLSYWDMARLCAHGKATVQLNKMEVNLLLPQNRIFLANLPEDKSLRKVMIERNSVQLVINQIDLNYENALVALQCLNTRVLLENSSFDSNNLLERSELICIPRIEIQAGLQWQSEDPPNQHYNYPFPLLHEEQAIASNPHLLRIFSTHIREPQKILFKQSSLLESLLVKTNRVSYWIQENGNASSLLNKRHEVYLERSHNTRAFKDYSSHLPESSVMESIKLKLWESICPDLLSRSEISVKASAPKIRLVSSRAAMDDIATEV